MNIYIYITVCIYVNKYIYIYVLLYVYYVYMYACIYVSKHICIYVYMYLCIYVNIVEISPPVYVWLKFVSSLVQDSPRQQARGKRACSVFARDTLSKCMYHIRIYIHVYVYIKTCMQI